MEDDRLNNTAGIANLDGIVINPNLQNITIKNGTVSNFTNHGINIGNGCNNITLENLTIQNCLRAFEFIGSAASRIQNVYVKNCKILACGNSASADFIVTFSNCVKANMLDCYIADTSSTSVNPVSFLFLNSCDNAQIARLNMQNNSASSITNCINLNSVSGSRFNDIFVGENLSSTSTLNIFSLGTTSDCTFSDISSIQNAGLNQLNCFLATSSMNKLVFDNILMQDCSANNLTGMLTTSLMAANVIKNFTMQQNQASTGNLTGILTTTLMNANIIQNFVMQQNQITVSGNMQGFSMANGVSALYCENCFFQRNVVQTGNMTGYEIDSGATTSGNSILVNCIVQRNLIQISGNFTGVSLNATGTTLSNVILRDCKIENNQTASGSMNGFTLQNGTGVTISDNQFFDCIALGNVSLAGITNGFSINGTGGTNLRNTFYDCVSNSNTSGGANNCNGYLVTSADFGTFLRCTGSYNSAPGAGATTTGSGLTFATSANRWVVRENQFVNNRGNSNANSWGVNQVAGTSILYSKNVAYNNALTPPGTNTTGYSGVGSVMAIGSGTIAGATSLSAGAAAGFPWANLGGIS